MDLSYYSDGMTTSTDEALAIRLPAMLRALSHPARLSIFKMLTAEGELSCMELTRRTELAQSTISEHLKVLKDSGLVRQTGPGLRAQYGINRDAVVWMKHTIASLWEGPMPPIRVLFLCTGNSARSIIAEALLRDIGGDAFEVCSAGTEPKGLNPYTVRVLQQAGLPTTNLASKSLVVYEHQKFDYVITVCDRAAETCPVFPGDPERIHWSFTDPAAVEGEEVVRLAAFQETLRGMRKRIEMFSIVAMKQANTTGGRA